MIVVTDRDASAASKEQTVRGYKVKTSYKPLSETEKKARQKIIAETVCRRCEKRIRTEMTTKKRKETDLRTGNLDKSNYKSAHKLP